MTSKLIGGIIESKEVKESSINLYMNNLKRLNDGEEVKNFNFLKDPDVILKKLEHYKPNTRRSYLISIVSMLKNQEKMKKPFKIYYDLMMQMNKDLQTNTDKSETQKENWISQDQVKEIYNNVKEQIQDKINNKKINSIDWEKLINYVVLSLYVLQPPRRCMDFLKMKFINSYDDSLNKEYNYLDITNKKFYFNNFKTAKTYKCQEIDINDELYNVLINYIKFHPMKSELKKKKAIIPFLVKHDGEAYTTPNTITRILNKIFHKKISVSMLRNIYLTDKYANENKEKKDDAKAMGTSVNMIDNQYTKN